MAWVADNWLYPLYDAQSTVHFEQRGAARSPTTLALSMLQARLDTFDQLMFYLYTISGKFLEIYAPY